jgi:hypothetical protein
MITCRCRVEGCGKTQDFRDVKEARNAGWWVNPSPGVGPDDLCPKHFGETEVEV